MLQEFIAKAIWFLKIYYVENQLLVQFLLLFVITYMLLMYWLNPRLSPVLRKVLAIFCLLVELAGIAYWDSGRLAHLIDMSWKCSGPIKSGFSAEMWNLEWK